MKIFSITRWSKNFLAEALLWILGLLSLAVSDPRIQEHFSLCLLKNLGFNYCPGCGLGHSISYFFHGELLRSFEVHPLGIVALLFLTARIVLLLRKSFLQ